MTDEITVELEDDIIDRLREMARQRGVSLDEFAHEILRHVTDPALPEGDASETSCRQQQ